MILVTGGAGYIGSHTLRQLLDAGFSAVCLDNLYSGHRWAIDPRASFIEGDCGDAELVTRVLREHRIDSLVHFAAHIEVPESVAQPQKYYRNNTANALTLFSVAKAEGVKHVIFSSTAAVYGAAGEKPVAEDFPTEPINPYGRSKLFSEWILKDLLQAAKLEDQDFRAIILRYFNVAGARVDGTLGQATPRATHLLKVACETACGKRPQLEIFGTDYPTEDGTCVRDYIHVDDLASAHVLALQALIAGQPSNVFNCGYGRGFSVRQLIEEVKSVSGIDFKVVESPRRAGDPAAVVAQSDKIKKILGWKPKFADLAVICQSAYAWEKKGARG